MWKHKRYQDHIKYRSIAWKCSRLKQKNFSIFMFWKIVGMYKVWWWYWWGINPSISVNWRKKLMRLPLSFPRIINLNGIKGVRIMFWRLIISLHFCFFDHYCLKFTIILSHLSSFACNGMSVMRPITILFDNLSFLLYFKII